MVADIVHMATVKNNGSGRRLLGNMYRTILLRLNRAICLFLPCPNILLPNERRTRKLVACAFVVRTCLCVCMWEGGGEVIRCLVLKIIWVNVFISGLYLMPVSPKEMT